MMNQIELLMDALQGEDTPTEIFGSTLQGDEAIVARTNLSALAHLARRNFEEMFGIRIGPDDSGIAALDRVIKEMWHDGWTAEDGNLDLFASHFGALLADALVALAGTVTVFRSASNLNHFSVWLPKKRIEYFPFHKACKCLSYSEGESMAQLYRDAWK
jgi:hypothetical protein